MDPVESRLDVLIDGMEKKEQALAEIVSITENQRTVIDSGLTEEEIRAFILQMNREKQGFIQTVIQCDTMFEQVLKEIGASLDNNPDLYKPQIADLQARIRRVMDLDVKIRVSEDQNNRRLKSLYPLREDAPTATANIPTASAAQKAPPQTPVMKDDAKVIKAYENNTKNYKG